MADKLGEVYVEIAAKADKILSQFKSIEAAAATSAAKIEGEFSRTKLAVNNSMATKSLADVQKMHSALKSKLDQKIALNADIASIDRTRNVLGTVEAKLLGLNKAGVSAGKGIAAPFMGLPPELTKMVVGFIGVAGAIKITKMAFDFLGTSLEAFEARKRALKGVDSTIHSMGKEGEYTAGGILSMATRLAEFNKYAVKTNEVLDLSTFLLTFDKISKDSLPRATQIVIDLSRKMDTDLKGAALSVGIALDNPAEGLTRLGRSGIKFSKDEKEAIQALVDTGKAAEAQEMIFAKLEKKIGGFARNTQDDMDAYEGAISAAFSRIKRSVGEMIEGALEPLAAGFLKALPKDMNLELDKLSTKVQKQGAYVWQTANTYDYLSSKQNRNLEEDKELTAAIEELANAFPGAIDGWDKYGNAISVNTGKLRAMIVEEQNHLKYMNEIKLKAVEADEASTKAQMEDLKFKIQKGTYTDYTTSMNRGGASKGLPSSYTPEELREMNDKVKSLGDRLSGIQKEKGILSGAYLDEKAGPARPGSLDPVKKTEEQLKQELEAYRRYLAAKDALNAASHEEEWQRSMQEAIDARAAALREIDDRRRLAKERPGKDTAYSAEAEANDRRAVALTYEKSEIEATRREVDRQKAARNEILAKEAAYTSEMKNYNRELVDQQIKNFALTNAEYKAYLDDQLKYQILALEEKNREIEEFNKKNGTNQELRDIGTFAVAGEKENAMQAGVYAQGKKDHAKEQFRKQHKEIARALEGLEGDLGASWGSTLDEMTRGTIDFSEGIERIFTGLVDSVIAQLARMAAEMAASWFMEALFNVASLGLSGAAGGGKIISGGGGEWVAHSGGTFLGGPHGLRRMAGGGSFVVPGGFPNDSYPLMVESGERVSVTPAGSPSGSGADGTAALLQKLDVLNMNLVNSRRQSVSGSIKVESVGRIQGEDIYYANKRATKSYMRVR